MKFIKLNAIPQFLKAKKIGFEYVIVTDTKVQKLFGDGFLKSFRKNGLRASLIAIPSGEQNKTLKTAEEILQKMAANGLKRDSCLLALGGGVVGDIAGFCASVFMRGIPYVHIPTTLLAMIDSSIGGKTGVDLPQGKNLVGTFHQPEEIFIDIECIRRLPDSEFKNGLAEMVKHAVIASPKLFNLVEKNAEKLSPSAPMPLLKKLIAENIKIKQKIVSADKKESVAAVKTSSKKTSRMFLNYGHTIGHAVEKCTNYGISHGGAVSIGMCIENIIAVKKNFLKPKDAKRIKNLLKTLGLKTSLPRSVSLRAIDRAIKADKKIVGGKIHFAIPTKIGKMKLFSL